MILLIREEEPMSIINKNISTSGFDADAPRTGWGTR
jgi:hypothetical protein